MSYHQGYPQQTQNFFQPGYQPSLPEPFPEPEPRTNPATAIIGALLGLTAAATLVVVALEVLTSLPEGFGFGDLPGGTRTLLHLRAAAAGVLVIGAILVLVRRLFGAVLLLLGAGGAIASVVLYPALLAEAGSDIGLAAYLKTVFRFQTTEATFTALTLIVSPLALIFAILPPTLRHLRSRSSGGPVADSRRDPPHQTGW